MGAISLTAQSRCPLIYLAVTSSQPHVAGDHAVAEYDQSRAFANLCRTLWALNDVWGSVLRPAGRALPFALG
jgi:hypothetical protein